MEVKFVEFEDPAVQLGFERLGRVLQFLKKPLDQMESVVLEGKYRQDESIKTIEVQLILQKKLALEPGVAFQFARFLVEEQDEEGPGAETIVLDPNRQINSQYIPIRLMTFFNYYPAPYSEEETEASKKNFRDAFDTNARGHFVKEVMTQEDAIVSFTRFKRYIKKHVTDVKHLEAKDIDCVYLMLLKGGKDDFTKLTEAQLADRTRGFDTEKIAMLFPDVDIDDVTSAAPSKAAITKVAENGLADSKRLGSDAKEKTIVVQEALVVIEALDPFDLGESVNLSSA